MKQKFDVTGMTCSACSAHVEKAVNKLEGVRRAEVSLMTNSMNVEYDEAALAPESIIQAVVQAGYGASLPAQAGVPARGAAKRPEAQMEAELSSMKRRLILSFLFLIPLFYISMGHMMGAPLPAFLVGHENAISFAFTQLLLTLPILYINDKYYKNGFRSLLHGGPNMDSLIAVGSIAAVIYGVFAIYQIGYGLGHGDMARVEQYHMDLYFESAGMILTLITLGKFLETRSKGKTSQAISRLMDLAPKTATKITTAQVDADKVEEVIALIKSYQPDLVMNIALPYQDLTIMDACLACGVNYMDTANYEPENTDDPEWRAIYEKRCKEAGFSAYFDYSWQWAYKKKFEDAGLTALLGCGFDPGVTQAYCAYAAKHEFDSIDTIDILDCNGGDHGYAFATNFNPEINLREVSAPGSYMANGKWVEIPAMSIKREYNFDQVGQKDMYLLHHEEIESLGKNLPDVKRIRFFMTFGQSYLDHMRCLEDVGMLSTTPINYNGQEIVPIQFLKALLPDPASLGPRPKGKTNIGCIFTGKKDGKDKTYYIYNICDHQECYREVGSQAISYTTGVPAMCGALMMLTGEWVKPGVYTVEEFNPDPFLDALDKYGLPRSENHNPVLVD